MSSAAADNNNSSQQQKPKSKIAFAIIRMPDGTEHEIPLPPKTFSTGREGYYAQIPGFVYNDDIYGGQIQVWKKSGGGGGSNNNGDNKTGRKA